MISAVFDEDSFSSWDVGPLQPAAGEEYREALARAAARRDVTSRW